MVRWPGPILIASLALALVGLLALPRLRNNYNDREYMPPDLPANVGFAAADRHFPQARMNPELLMIETDHDLRNSADMLVIDKVAKNIFHIPGVGRVQAITRPQGTPIEHTSIPFIISMSGATQQLNMSYMQDRMKDMLKMGDEMQATVDNMEQMYGLMTAAHRCHPRHGRQDQGDGGHHQRTARPHRRFRRFLPADPQLLLLGAALFRHPGLPGDAVGVRHPRRHRQAH